MKRLIVGVVAVLLALSALAGGVLAGDTAPAAKPRPAANLTDQEKATLTELQNQMFALREKMIDRWVEFKLISPERAQLMKDRLALMKKNAAQYGFGPGAGFGFGRRGGFGGGRRGYGMMGGFGPAGYCGNGF